ncbi:MAG: DUF302 domain-containing protein [bacterium]
MNFEDLAFRLKSDKPFDEVVRNIHEQTAAHKFRVLAEHDVQQTLKEKGLERGPLKIIEVCNAGFAHKATQKEIGVALFMPCRYTIHTDGKKTVAALARPSMISAMLPEAGLDELAAEVEQTLKSIMEKSV